MQGKVVIITGGGTGISRATALAFAKAQAQAVIITGRSQRSLNETLEEVKKFGIEAGYIVADITDKTQMQDVFTNVKTVFYKIDVEFTSGGKHLRSTPKSFIVIQAFVQHAAPDATLVNITTALAHIPYFPEFSSYGASKLATIRVLQDVHMEHPEFRMFSVQPGLIDTETSSKSSVPGEDTVDLPASFSVWLATAEADFLRGRTMWANWDVDELLAKSETISKNDDLKIYLKGWPDV